MFLPLHHELGPAPYGFLPLVWAAVVLLGARLLASLRRQFRRRR